ncbi:MAG: hypothetical protein JXB03_12505 [Spirochaetales bacterium]|nr:hypothetical protein [Spirochaetales bacterium]
MNKRVWLLLMILFPSLSGLSFVSARMFTDVEAGAAFTGYNDARIPSETGTDISLSGDTPGPAVPVIRVRAGFVLWDRHSFSLLAAPLLVRGSGTLDRPVSFGGTVFSQGAEVESLYRFDSYRMSWQWQFYEGRRLSAAAGLTAKLRSADISLMGDEGYARRSDLGVVPLINFRLQWKFLPEYSLLLDGDALWSPFGRAEDVLVAFQYHRGGNTDFRIGYRVLEGGSDGGGSVYTFALFHYLTAGVRVRF